MASRQHSGRRRNGWKEHLRQQHLMEQHQASVEAGIIQARLQARLSEAEWEAIEVEWRELPDEEAYLPTQRLNYLIAQADAHGLLDVVPLSVFGG